LGRVFRPFTVVVSFNISSYKKFTHTNTAEALAHTRADAPDGIFLAMKTTLLLLVALSLGAPAHAKRRRGGTAGGPTTTQLRKRECEQDCKDVNEDDRGNCVLRCQSEACYEEIYAPEELEPGEIDLKRQRLYNACITKEAREAAIAYRTNKQAPKAAEGGSESTPAGGKPAAGENTEAATDTSGGHQPQVEL
jgi:hypothetical protein